MWRCYSSARATKHSFCADAQLQEVGTMTCRKCMGFMVEEWRPDFSPESTAFRCINCGLILDPLIEQNRLARLRANQPALDAA